MYLPKHFEQTELGAMHALVHAHPLATWVAQVGGELTANHIPMLLDAGRGPHGTLVGHVARANPVWREPGPALVIFRGADAYITPSWYPGKAVDGKVVPTWNYAVVHVHGRMRAVDDAEALRAIVTRLTNRHEGGRAAPWQVSDAPPDYVDKMLAAIVGIEIEIERWVGKSKLSQNRPAADRAAVAAGLQADSAPGAAAMAALIPQPR